MLPFFDEARVRAVLRMEELIPAIEGALVAFSAGRVAQALRQMLPVEPWGPFRCNASGGRRGKAVLREAGDVLFSGAEVYAELGGILAGAESGGQDGLDRINLQGLRAANGGVPLSLNDLLFTQVGSAVRIKLDLDNNGARDSIDLNGDRVADRVRIAVDNALVANFQAADFVF